MDLPIFRINRHTLCSKSCTHPFFHPSLPWNHWECREDFYIWIWIMWSTGGKGSERSFFVWNSLDRHTHAGTDSGMCSVTQQHGSFERLSQPESGLEKAVLESSMSVPIKSLVELVFIKLCVPWNTLLLHAGVYLWRQQSFWIGTVTVLGEL